MPFGHYCALRFDGRVFTDTAFGLDTGGMAGPPRTMRPTRTTVGRSERGQADTVLRARIDDRSLTYQYGRSGSAYIFGPLPPTARSTAARETQMPVS